jgi:hypothetical protein
MAVFPEGLCMPLRFFQKLLVAAALFLTAASVVYAVEPRKAFSIPLAMVAYFPSQDTVAEKVSVWFDKANECWEISEKEDRHILEKEMQTEQEIYRKSGSQGFILNSVEAQVISRVCKTLIKTLDGFEGDLKKDRWDKCRYLDSYLASFCSGFYHLITIAKSSKHALPEITCPPDSLYERSPESPKSDVRIDQWRQSSDHVMKLRIAARELIYRIKDWQKKELENPKRDSWEDQSANFVEAYELFIRLYFNFPPKNGRL